MQAITTPGDALLRTSARLAEKIHAPHDPLFIPTMDELPARYVLELYPYTADAAYKYVHAGLLPQRHLWGNGNKDVRQQRLNNLVRAGQLPWRLLGAYYQYDIAQVQVAAALSNTPLVPAGEERHVTVTSADVKMITQLLLYLQLDPARLVTRAGAVVETATLRDALAMFTSAFCKL